MNKQQRLTETKQFTQNIHVYQQKCPHFQSGIGLHLEYYSLARNQKSQISEYQGKYTINFHLILMYQIGEDETLFNKDDIW